MRAHALLLLAAACGDAGTVLVEIEPTSGARIKLERYLYEDGTREIDGSGFYDTRLHTRCTAQRWVDDVVRCVPVAGDAIYTDAACTDVVGVAAHVSGAPGAPLDDSLVSHFIGYDIDDGVPVPARLYTAGDETAAIATYFARQDGVCAGPFTPPADTKYYTVASEIAGTVMPALTETELGAGRLGLRVLGTTDGLRLPIGLVDRELGVACTPRVQSDGVACAPQGAAEPIAFFDSTCSAPAIIVDNRSDLAPTTAHVTDGAGCATYAAVGDEVLSSVIYARAGDACLRADLGPGQRAFTVGDTLELPRFERTIDDGRGRLAHVTLQDTADAELRFDGDRLYDRAIRDECHRFMIDGTARCVPDVTRWTKTLYESGCNVPVIVVELPERTCGSIAFATSLGDDGVSVTFHAIGNRVTTTLSALAGGCVEYTPLAGYVLYEVGPVLPPETFMSALKYGDR